MTINKSKTVLQELMVKQKRCKQKGEPPHLVTREDNGNIKIVKSTKSNILLGAAIQVDLQLRSHMETGENPLLASIRQKIETLKHLGNAIPRKSKLQLANRLIVSKILYLIPLYGGTYPKYMDKLQILLNNTMRIITGLGKRTKCRKLLEEVKWLSIYELAELHSIILTWKMINLGAPSYLSEKIKITEDNMISTDKPRLQNTARGFRWRCVPLWNSMEQDIRTETSLPIFKKNLKKIDNLKKTPRSAAATSELMIC